MMTLLKISKKIKECGKEDREEKKIRIIKKRYTRSGRIDEEKG